MLDKDTRAQRAAVIIKAFRLARTPGMDDIAIKLNMEPMHAEKQSALQWQRAFELADGPGSAYQLAAELAKEFP